MPAEPPACANVLASVPLRSTTGTSSSFTLEPQATRVVATRAVARTPAQRRPDDGRANDPSKACIGSAGVRVSFNMGCPLGVVVGVFERKARSPPRGSAWRHGLTQEGTPFRFANIPLRAGQPVELRYPNAVRPWQHVLDQLRPGATIGRPAIGDALVELGHAADRSDAFNFLLSERGPYFVPHTAPDTLEMIGTIRAAGGVPVIAHPLTGFTEEARRKNLPQEHFEQLIAAGLAGFEVFHRDVPELAREWLLDLAQHHDLIVTGSSDYHGVSGKPNRLGENMTDPEMLERILQQGSGTHPRF